ncbi:site-specific integrase [Rhodococcus opacus]|uniref:site-specific integrase n=1 Tax=Rhodococcus opacus TaxID=37919 RepID=UPI001F582527|nr:site-specific integrase [Rhodococcus opacus]UNN04776.1 site-specific integrase [Rhodococcus opacus]UNN05091.1 site-specific integrase [Rhodococcus opacus]
MDSGLAAQQGWTLNFYDFQRRWASVESLVSGVDDVLTRARRNGAVDGTPFFIDPWGRADPLVNAYWRAPRPGAMGLKIDTVRRYAYSLKVWLDFLHAVGARWDTAARDELAMFKQWRLSAEENPDAISPSAFHVDRAAIRRFYEWAAHHRPVDNPVRVRLIDRGLDGVTAKEVLEGTPSAVRRADVKWMTPEAFRLWRNLGLRGFTMDGLPADTWQGRTEDRDTAFAEGLFGTGLRMGEWSSQLTIEIPASHGAGLFRGQLSAACAKGAVGRRFWMRRRVAQLVRYYIDDGSRAAAIARAQVAGRYEHVQGRWLLRQVRRGGVIEVVDDLGRLRDVHLDAMGPPASDEAVSGGRRRPGTGVVVVERRRYAATEEGLVQDVRSRQYPGCAGDGHREWAGPIVVSTAYAAAFFRVALVLHCDLRCLASDQRADDKGAARLP